MRGEALQEIVLFGEWASRLSDHPVRSAITILLGALYLVMCATGDKPPPLPPREPVSQWIMMGRCTI